LEIDIGTSNRQSPEARISVRRKTTTMTFRIESDIIQRLKNKAEQDEITLNTLVNHILKRYIEWGMYAEDRIGIVSIARPVAEELFNKMDKEEVVRLATEVGKGAAIDLTLFMKGNLSPSSFIDWFLPRMKNSSASVASKSNSDGVQSYVIKHDMGENWSLYHKTVVESIFNEMQKPIHIGATESTLTLEITY
jgi:predicted DNA-binding ribbon-helix-helix protein